MRLYAYKAVDRAGEILQGELEAPDEAAAVRQLQDEGYLPISTSPIERRRRRAMFSLPRRSERISAKDITDFTRELATLLQAGLPLDRALQTLHDLADDPRMAHMVAHVQDQVRGGAAFSDALESQGRVFSRLYVNMVRAGEAGGSLELVLEQLADYLERVRELRENVLSALIYPSILMFVAGASVILLLVYVVPQFEQLFSDMGRALPLPTQIVIALGDGLRGYWWVMVAGLALVVIAIQKLLESPERRYRWHHMVLKLPLFGDLVSKLEVARFSHTLGTLARNGVPLLAALEIVKEVVSNQVLARAVADATESLKQGKGLTEPLIETGVFPKLALQMMKVGGESGQLETMLGKVGDTYDREVRTTVQRMLALIEPVLIIGMGVVVAGIIISILLAILSLNDLGF